MVKPKLNIASVCSGIGMSERGIENTDCFEANIVAMSEINIDAIISYATIHNGLTEEMVDTYPDYPSSAEMRAYLTDLNIGYSPEKDKPYVWTKSGKAFERKVKKTWLACMLSKNVGDISKVERLPKADIWFLSFPCTDLSNAGKMAGMTEGSGTRSSLVWNTIRLLEVAKESSTLPSYMILENVKNLVSKTFIDDFNRFNKLIEDEFGYSVRWQIINGRNSGVAQNRERVFVVYIRKDIDKGNFVFPEPFDTGVRLKDILSDDVDESYYVNTEKSEELIKKLVYENKIDIEKYAKERL